MRKPLALILLSCVLCVAATAQQSALHRIRLQISASFTPNFSRNLQSEKSEVNSVEMKRAHIRVFHDAKHLSQVVLRIIPIVK